MLDVSPKVVLMIQVVVVVGLPLILWRFLHFGRLLPLPIVQIFAGVLLGPSIFGALMPDMYNFLFRKEVLAGVDTLSNVSVILFIFLAGCEADRGIIRGSAGMVLRIGLSGIAAPWILGGLTAWAMVTHGFGPEVAARLLGSNQSPVLFAVAFGLAMAVTALPVLVVVLRELNFTARPIGSIALAIGGLDDMTLWLSIGALLPFAAGGAAYLAFGIAVAGAIATVVLVAGIVAPLLSRMIASETSERFLMSAAILVLFAAATITEITGVHAAVGAFVTGLFLPDKIRHMAQSRFDVPVSLLLLPFFFLSTGLKTSFNFADPYIWLVVAVSFVVCIGGKFVGISIPAVLSGQSGAFAVTLGVLMQCKGLMEIVVVTVFYQRGIIGELTFSGLVLTALLSTVVTVPLAKLCERRFGAAATATRQPQPVEVALPKGPVEVRASAPVLVLKDDGTVLPMTKTEVVIGRHTDDDIRVKDLRLSRHHAAIRAVGGGRYEIHNLTADRSEPNPMLINGVEREHAELADGDDVSLGGVDFIFRKEAAVAAAA